MSLEFGKIRSKSEDIWIWVHTRAGAVEELTKGLAGEARRLLPSRGETATVTAVVLGPVAEEELKGLGHFGVQRVLWCREDHRPEVPGERTAWLLADLIRTRQPSFFLLAQTAETGDWAPRLAALLETGLITRALDAQVDGRGKAWAVRAVANGHLFERVYFADQTPHILTFLPSVLTSEKIPVPANPEITEIFLQDQSERQGTRLLERFEAPPEVLDLEEADLIVCGGRGVGREGSFSVVHELAGVLGGTVGGTRPVIDSKTLTFERQIGQTGKTVSPRLLVACGISGANEFTVGMEKSKLVLAINTDPQARIFRLADLGVVGDVHKLLPILIEKLHKMKEPK